MTATQLFESQQVRSEWDAAQELWYFSIVDVVSVLTDSPNPRKYWSVLKNRLNKEGSQLTTTCSQLKLRAADGKMYLSDVANTEQLLRLIQSIPSPKAEPFKQWLAAVGYQRIQETADPELTLDRALATYLKKGYSRDWINQRLKSIEVRKELTDEWEDRGISAGGDFAILTNEITQAWSGLTTQEYKKLKSLKQENLRDHMTNMELVLNMLAEATTTEISKERKPQGIKENTDIARAGGTIAGNTRKQIEAQSGKAIISGKNAKRLSKTNKTN
jgi:BRO family, N-terminal domain